ncbi:hypothetical protein, partial [Latilactobacillus curvatus]|uniref:hypothetical protein n=1 Tax=Latilactobacillus curvatus TaxID=28038 RepID=UPI00217E8F40
VDLVDGLETFVDGKIPEMPEIPEYKPVTPITDGLMSAADKVKLDALNNNFIKLYSPDGTPFLVKVTNEGKLEISKGGNK